MDVSAWLKQLGLAEYAAAFEANHVDWATLKELTADDLRDMGVVSIGHRRRLLSAIAALGQPPVDAESPANSGAERRPVTVLFADLCGFTALTQELPDEVIHGMLDQFLAAADETVRQNGGTVDKHIGDAVMALFGAPVAHDTTCCGPCRRLHGCASKWRISRAPSAARLPCTPGSQRAT